MVCLKRSISLFALLLFWVSPALAQTCATTEHGRQVVLSEDGSWKYARGDECEPAKSSQTEGEKTEVLIGSERHPAGVSETIVEDGLHTIKAQVVDRNGQALLVLWSESEGACVGNSYFGDGYSDHDTRLFLSNSEMIRFIDRGNKGSRTLRDARTRTETSYTLGETTEIEKEVDVCQQWIAYRITSSEVDKIAESAITKIELETGMKARAELFRVKRNKHTLAKQIRALGL